MSNTADCVAPSLFVALVLVALGGLYSTNINTQKEKDKPPPCGSSYSATSKISPATAVAPKP